MPRPTRLARDVRVLAEALDTLPAPQARPALVLLSGLPGSGKSYLASEICRRYPLARLESDALRKALFRRPVYSPQESSRLFAAVHALIDNLLAKSIPVLLDATNLKEAHRQPLYEIAQRRGAGLVLVQTAAPEPVVRKRMGARLAGANPRDRSDADIDIYDMMLAEAEPIQHDHLVVDTAGDIGAAADKIVRELQAVSS